MLPAKLPSKQLQVIWYSVINSIIHQWWSGKCYCLLPKYLYLTHTWLKKYLMYLMSSKYSEYLNLYLYLQIWKSTCTWLKYFEKYLTPTLLSTSEPVLLESFWSDSDVPMRSSRRLRSWNSTWQGISVSKPLWFRKLSIYYKCMYKCKRFHMFKTKLEWCP